MLFTAHGDWSAHMYAEPPLHPEAAEASVSGESLMSQVVTGAETAALPDQAQDGYHCTLEKVELFEVRR